MSIFDAALTSDQIQGEAVHLLYVPLSAFDLDRDLWEKNAKKHDRKALLESIETYGFLDPPKFDTRLNNGAGGIIYGNGRTEAIVSLLMELKRSGGDAPRGIPIAKSTGEWCIPVKFGVDQRSEALAMGLAIDHNNLTMMGGDFDASDMASMWDDSYIDLLKGLADVDLLPVSMAPIDLADLMMGVSELNPAVYEEPEGRRSGSTEAESTQGFPPKKCPHCGENL